jgi:ATPases involved in chromosome partitioning
MAIVIGIVNRKGGVGKTTTVKNLAYSLALLKKRVLVMDFDPQCNSTKGLCKRKFDKNISDVLAGKDIKRCIYHTRHNMDIIPGDQYLGSTKIEKNILNEQLDKIKDEYDYILGDTSPFFNELIAEILLSSHLIIIPTEIEVDSLDGMTTAINELLYLCGHKVKYKLLFTKVTNLKSVNDDIKDLDSVLKKERMKTVIRYHRYAVARARKYQQPLAKRYKMASVTKDYKALAKEIVEMEDK